MKEKIMRSFIKKIFNPIFKLREEINDFNKFKTEKEFYTGISYGQNFEDLVFSLVCNKKNGFYVDVGAHNPIRFSNTYNLSKKGWSGINIDPLPECMPLFNKLRPNDINLNIGISTTKGLLTYYSFIEPAYNTLSSTRATEILENKWTELKEEIKVPVDTLENVFDKYLNNRDIDLLTIDVETKELEVLKSNNWDKYNPNYIIMESLVNHDESLNNIYKDKAVKFLCNHDYIVIAKVANAIFLKKL